MHEFSLYGTVSRVDHDRVKQQLAGVARMQPKEVEEIHLILKAKIPAGLASLPSSGGSQGVMQQDLQKTKNMLNASLYYVQLVGHLPLKSKYQSIGSASNGALQSAAAMVRWSLEFKDTPDAGKQPVSSRLVIRTPLEDGDLVQFFEQFGYEYISRYLVQGYKFYDQDTTLFLYQSLHLPQVSNSSEAANISLLPATSELSPVDPGKQHILQASIDVTEGNHPELKDRATKQLLAMKQILGRAVDLTPGDRLALDTKLPVIRRI